MWRVRPGRHRQALLQQRLELLLPHPLAPTRQRRTVEHQRMMEKLLATEVLEARILHPAIAQSLVARQLHQRVFHVDDLVKPRVGTDPAHWFPVARVVASQISRSISSSEQNHGLRFEGILKIDLQGNRPPKAKNRQIRLLERAQSFSPFNSF